MKTTINQRVFLLREKLGYTQQDFVNVCGLTTTSLSRIENGEVEPQNKTLKKIIDNTGVDPVWLLEGKGELTIQEVVKENTSTNLYQDALYKELKQDKETWQQKYNDLFAMFNKFIDRGGSLGKPKSFGQLAGLLKDSRSKVRVN